MAGVQLYLATQAPDRRALAPLPGSGRAGLLVVVCTVVLAAAVQYLAFGLSPTDIRKPQDLDLLVAADGSLDLAAVSNRASTDRTTAFWRSALAAGAGLAVWDDPHAHAPPGGPHRLAARYPAIKTP